MSSLLDHHAIVVEQKRKLFELRNQYGLFTTDGERVGTIEQVRQGAVAVAARILTALDVVLPVTLEVTDDGAGGAPVMEIHKPWFRWQADVDDPAGRTLGSIRKQLRFGKARFLIEDPTGMPMGEVHAQNWRAKDFSIQDQNGMEVARVTKKWRGILTESFTDADTYVVDFGTAQEPMRSLALASALSIDIIMKQKDY